MSYPKLVRNPQTPVHVVLKGEDTNEFGEKITFVDENFLCNYQDAAAVKFSSSKQGVYITGTIYIDGDIAPNLAVVSAGYVDIFGEKRVIAKGNKARNLDGSVNYTRLDVI